MTFATAYKSVGKLYRAGIMMLIATSITSVGLILTLLISSVLYHDLLGDPMDYGETYASFVTKGTSIAVYGSVMMHLGLVLLVISYFMLVMALRFTLKDGPLFRQGLILSIVMLALSFGAFLMLTFKGNYRICFAMLFLSAIANMFIMILVINALRKLYSEISGKRAAFVAVIMIIALVFALMEFVFSKYAFALAGISGVAMIVSYICYPAVIAKARKELYLP
ncbi:MAG: hypothetical protein E7242_06135 [Lachnospiraceae bacterium]|nr:hypothetical protein [Lachnospiraceae bacterium]